MFSLYFVLCVMVKELNLGNLSVNFSGSGHKKLEEKSHERLRSFLLFIQDQPFKDFIVGEIETCEGHFRIHITYNEFAKVPSELRQKIEKKYTLCEIKTEGNQDIIYLPFPKKRSYISTFFSEWILPFILFLLIIIFIQLGIKEYFIKYMGTVKDLVLVKKINTL